MDKRINVWDTRFEELEQYLLDNDGSYPTQKTQLGRWIGTQRQQKKNGILSQERINKLNSIDFDWGGALSDFWEIRFEELKQYLLANVGKYPSRKIQLGTWVNAQRTLKNKEILSKERIERLNSIDFKWSVR